MSGAGATTRIRLDVAYLGSAFHGFAENRGVRTVGGDLRAALETVLDGPVVLTCAGRTDTGVHARGQVVTFDVSDEVLAGLAERDRRGSGDGLRRLRDGVNALVGPAVVVTAATRAAVEFDARFSARSRTYRYVVWNAEVPDPFLADRAWWVQRPLDVEAMDAACRNLIGEHDFSTFCRRPKPASSNAEPPSLVRRVLAAGWSADPGDRRRLTFTITATSFCHQMVRSVTGLLVDVGRGRRRESDVAAALSARDRSQVGSLAPPHGLVLWHVDY
ncbi:MAG: tRNA pseudouridine(38-40) synthase TruA [Actinobacteria bacterium]|nr:tRNA pseudouridine(38-40) synthase TruA [Actinomycetota bacterium]